MRDALRRAERRAWLDLISVVLGTFLLVFAVLNALSDEYAKATYQLVLGLYLTEQARS